MILNRASLKQYLSNTQIVYKEGQLYFRTNIKHSCLSGVLHWGCNSLISV